MHIAPMTWKHQSINKQTYDHKEINKWKKKCTLLDTNYPNGSWRIVTEPLSPSSKTVADTVDLIGTPCLLSYVKKVWKSKKGRIKKNKNSLLHSQKEKKVKV